MRPVNEIIIHCTATQPNWWADKPTSAKVQEIRRWHKAQGWRDIGYHYLIDRDGTVAEGRPVEQVGAHVKGRNTGTIGVALFGGHGSAATDQFSDHFTLRQANALRGLIAKLQADYGPLAVSGHNQFAAKACPGFNAPEWYAWKPASAPVAARKPSPIPTPPDAPATAFLRGLRAVLAALWAAVRLIFSKSA